MAQAPTENFESNTEQGSDQAYDPATDPDQGHPTDPTSRTDSITTRSKDTNEEKKAEVDNIPFISASSGSDNGSDSNVLDFTLDTVALQRQFEQFAPFDDAAEVKQPIDDLTDSDVKMEPKAPTEFESILLTLREQVPTFDWNPTFEGFIWRDLVDKEVRRIRRIIAPTWSMDEYIGYKQRRASVLNDLTSEFKVFMRACVDKQITKQARAAYKLFMNLDDKLAAYALKPVEKIEERQQMVRHYDRARDIFLKLAVMRIEPNNLALSEVLFGIKPFELPWRFKAGLHRWMDIKGVPKIPRKSKKRSRKHSNGLPTLPKLPKIGVKPTQDVGKLSFDEILEKLKASDCTPALRDQLHAQLKVIQQRVAEAGELRGHNKAAEYKEEIEYDSDSKLEELGAPAKKRQKLSGRDSRLEQAQQAARAQV